MDQILEGDFTTKLEYNSDRSIKRYWIGSGGNFTSYLSYEYNRGLNVSRTYYVVQSGTAVAFSQHTLFYNSSDELIQLIVTMNDEWYSKCYFEYANHRISKMTMMNRDNPDSTIYELSYDSHGNVGTIILNDFNIDTKEWIFQEERRMEYDDKLNPFHAFMSPNDIYKLGPNNMVKQANFHPNVDGSTYEEGKNISYDYNSQGFPVRSVTTYYGAIGPETEVRYSYMWK